MPLTKILIGKAEQPVQLLAKYGNRHGMVAGATGTGKTISLLVLAEGFSRLGVPVVHRGREGRRRRARDAWNRRTRRSRSASRRSASRATPARAIRWCSGICTARRAIRCARRSARLARRFCARMLELNDTQAGHARNRLQAGRRSGPAAARPRRSARPARVSSRTTARTISTQYGLVSTQSVAAIQRALLSLEREGGKAFFGEPALELLDLMRTDLTGRGIVNILAADQLVLKPRLYSSFLLWLLSELFEKLPEVGDLEQAEAGVLLRRGAPAVRRRAAGAAPAGGAGRAAHSLEGRRRLLLLAVSGRRAERDPGPARATASSTRCAPTPRATRRRCARRPRPSWPIPSSMSRR